MLWNASGLIGYSIQARDGAIGRIDDLYFDDQTWTVRWLAVDTGAWLSGRRVLLTPFSITGHNVRKRIVSVALTTDQVKTSPDVDARKPASRRDEERLLRYYGWPPYWTSVPNEMPAVPRSATSANAEAVVATELARGPDWNLRSTREVRGYDVHALDGYIGHIEDFLIDADTWIIPHVVVDTRNWLPGRHVLVAPAWFSGIDWTLREVRANVTRQAVENSPPYPLSRDQFR